MKKRMTSLLVVLCLVFALIPTALAASASDFPDVKKGTWYYDAVDEVVSNGYFLGQGDGTFAPHKAMTRAMFVTVLSRVDGAVVDNSKSSFSDVPAGAWYTGAVTWAAQNSIVLGVGGDKFDPNRNINRVDMCLIMSRYISYYAAKTGRVPAVSGVVKTFGDTASLSASNKEAVEKCVSYGLIVGDDYGNFKPASNATRAEVAVIISRLAWITTGGGGTGVYNRYYRNYPGGGDSEWTQMYLGTVQGWAAVSANAGWTKPDGYDFDGWNTKPDGSGTDYAVGQAASRLFLYAQWKHEADDHINKAMTEAVSRGNQEAQDLYTAAYNELAELLAGSSVLEQVQKAKEATTFSIVLKDHNITVTFKTDANDENLRKLAVFAKDYALDMFRGNGTSAKEDVNDLTAKVKESLKKLLEDLGVKYEGDTMKQKLDTAAKNLAKLGKDKAVQYKDTLKDIFKNVDASNLAEAVKNGTTSVDGVTVSANETELLTADKNTTLTRADLEAAAQKAHEAVQKATGNAYASIDEIAGYVTGKIVFEPAETIAKNYKAAGGDYDAEYTVTFSVTTGTEDYLAYKFDGHYDHFRFAPTQVMWDEYVKSLETLRSKVVARLRPGTPAAANVFAPFAANTARFIGFTAPIAGTPVPTSAEDGGQMTMVELIHLLDDMFKQVTDNENDDHVDKAIDKWKEANKDNFTEDDMIDILLGEKTLDTEGLDNSAIDELVDQLVTEAVDKAKDEIKGTKAYDYERIEDLLDTKGGAQEFLGSSADSFFEANGRTPKPGYEGIVDHLFNSMADKINDERAEYITDEAEKAKAAAVKEKAEDKTELNTFVDNSIQAQMDNTDQIFEFAGELGYTEKIEDKIKDKFGDNVSIDDVKKALEFFDDARTRSELVKKTLGGAVDSMKSDAIKSLVEDRWTNYSARIQRVLTRANNALTRVLNSRFGDTAETATIQIGTNGNKVGVAALREILTGTYTTYNDFVSAVEKFVKTTANIGDLSIEKLATTPITIEAGKYSYTFFVEIDLEANITHD